MYTEHNPQRVMSIREFRGALKSDMPLPVIVQSDGEAVFAVVSFAMLRDLLDKMRAHKVKCPYCGHDGKPAQK